MKMKTTAMIEDLIEKTRYHLNTAEELWQLPDEQLNQRSGPDKWSALECVEHLNLYGDYYLPELSKALERARPAKREEFTCGWLGYYFAQSMIPRERLNTMKTFKNMNPLGSTLDRHVLATFRDQQNSLLQLLGKAAKLDLSGPRIPITISRLIRLKPGDTFRFLIHHNWRHIVQARKAAGI